MIQHCWCSPAFVHSSTISFVIVLHFLYLLIYLLFVCEWIMCVYLCLRASSNNFWSIQLSLPRSKYMTTLTGFVPIWSPNFTPINMYLWTHLKGCGIWMKWLWQQYNMWQEFVNIPEILGITMFVDTFRLVSSISSKFS